MSSGSDSDSDSDSDSVSSFSAGGSTTDTSGDEATRVSGVVPVGGGVVSAFLAVVVTNGGAGSAPASVSPTALQRSDYPKEKWFEAIVRNDFQKSSVIFILKYAYAVLAATIYSILSFDGVREDKTYKDWSFAGLMVLASFYAFCSFIMNPAMAVKFLVEGVQVVGDNSGLTQVSPSKMISDPRAYFQDVWKSSTHGKRAAAAVGIILPTATAVAGFQFSLDALDSLPGSKTNLIYLYYALFVPAFLANTLTTRAAGSVTIAFLVARLLREFWLRTGDFFKAMRGNSAAKDNQQLRKIAAELEAAVNHIKIEQLPDDEQDLLQIIQAVYVGFSQHSTVPTSSWVPSIVKFFQLLLSAASIASLPMFFIKSAEGLKHMELNIFASNIMGVIFFALSNQLFYTKVAIDFVPIGLKYISILIGRNQDRTPPACLPDPVKPYANKAILFLLLAAAAYVSFASGEGMERETRKATQNPNPPHAYKVFLGTFGGFFQWVVDTGCSPLFVQILAGPCANMVGGMRYFMDNIHKESLGKQRVLDAASAVRQLSYASRGAGGSRCIAVVGSDGKPQQMQVSQDKVRAMVQARSGWMDPRSRRGKGDVETGAGAGADAGADAGAASATTPLLFGAGRGGDSPSTVTTGQTGDSMGTFDSHSGSASPDQSLHGAGVGTNYSNGGSNGKAPYTGKASRRETEGSCVLRASGSSSS